VLSAVRVQDQGDQEEKSDAGNLGGRAKGDATKEEGNPFLEYCMSMRVHPLDRMERTCWASRRQVDETHCHA